MGLTRADLIATLKHFVAELEKVDNAECYLEMKTIGEKSVVIQVSENDQVIIDVVDEQRN